MDLSPYHDNHQFDIEVADTVKSNQPTQVTKSFSCIELHMYYIGKATLSKIASRPQQVFCIVTYPIFVISGVGSKRCME